MRLTDEQLALFERDGFLVFPDLFSQPEVDVLRAETARLSCGRRHALGGVYVYHTKINAKPAIEGTVWMWHQDYGSWQRDGCSRPDMATFAVMMTDSVEMNGALYVIPGSHKRGRIEPYYDDSTSYKFWAVPKAHVVKVLKSSPPAVPIVGRAGTAALFHCNTLHASGHNLTAEDRWHVVSRNTAPLPVEDDGAILKARTTTNRVPA